MQKLKLNLITTTFISLFCLLSILSFGQNTKNAAPELNAANSKNTGMRINHNANAGEIENTAEPVQKQLSQVKLENSEESFAKLWKNEPYGTQNISKELVEKRDANAKHFANEDGSISAHITSGPIHYKEKDEWKTIFHTISPTANGFENIHNSHKTYYPASATGSLKTVLENGVVLRDMINMNMYFSVNGEKVQVKTIQDNKGRADFNQLTYPNAYGNGIDLQLTHETTKRKMDYIIHNREAIGNIPTNATHLVFEETVELPTGWKAELKDNIIYIKDSKGEIQALYEKPFLEDSPNFDKLPKENIIKKAPEDIKPNDIEKLNFRDEGEYSIKQNGNLLTIQTAVTIEWITSEEREFPVKVDPTVNVSPNNATNWIRSVYDDGVAQSGGYFGRVSGYFLQSYIKFNTSTIPTSSTVNSVTGYINIIGAWGAWNGQWQFANSIDPTINSGSTLYSSANLGYSTIGSFNTSGWKSSAFYNPQGNEYVQSGVANGFVFAAVVPSGSYNPSVYYQFSDQTSTNKPYLSITYTAPAAIPTCTTPIMPTSGSSGHTPGDPLTWNAASGATSYLVYLGTSSNPTLVATVTTNSYTPTLANNTTYYWKILPRNGSNQGPANCTVWSFTTGTGPESGDYRTRYMDATNRMWSTASNWQVFNGTSWITASSSPNNSTVNVLIRDNSYIIIDGNYELNELRIEGLLQYYWGDGNSNNTAKILTVNGDVLMLGNADFQTSAAYDANRNFVHLLILKGNLYNNANADHGVLFNDYPEISYWSFVQVKFKGSGNAEWSGTGENDLGGLSILKDNPDDVVTIKPNQLLGWGSTNLDGNGFFMYDVIDHVGTLKIGGTFFMTTRFGIQSTNTAVDDTRQLPQISSVNSGSNFTLVLDNPNFGISGYSSVECYGNLHIMQGVMNVGDSMDDYIEFGDGSSLIVDGGDLTCTGAVAYLGSGSFNLRLSNGRIRAGYFGNSNSNIVGWFDIRNNASVNITGGEIHLINMNFTTTLDYPMYNMAASNVNITGGVLKIGSDASPAGANTFSIAGPTPSIELYTNNTTIFSNAIMWDNVNCYGYINIPVGCALSVYDQDHGDLSYNFSLSGNFNHLGDLYAEVENSKITFNGTTAQTFTSTGGYSGAGISLLEISNSAGVNLMGNGTTVTKNLNQIAGTFNIGNTELTLMGNITRSVGFLGGTDESRLNIFGQGELGNMFFDPALNNLKTLNLDRTTSGTAFLATDLKISESINFTSGILHTYRDGVIANGSQTVYLQPNAILHNENSNSYLYGKVNITKDLSSAIEPGNLGANFNNLNENLGSTTIERVTGDEGTQMITDASSIDCSWDIEVTTQPTTPVNMTFKWLDVFDNELPTSSMSVFTLHNPDPWAAIGTPVAVSGNPRTISAETNQFSKWTVAQKNEILPVSLLYFNVKCNDNIKILNWSTATETNNDYFIIQSSYDAKSFKDIGKVTGAGNSNQVNNYSFYDEQSSVNEVYYRLKQIDFDGTSETFEIIHADCNENANSEITAYPNPFDGKILYLNSTSTLKNAVINIYDALGRLVYQTKCNEINSHTELKIITQLEPGAYYLEISSKNELNKRISLIVK